MRRGSPGGGEAFLDSSSVQRRVEHQGARNAASFSRLGPVASEARNARMMRLGRLRGEHVHAQPARGHQHQPAGPVRMGSANRTECRHRASCRPDRPLDAGAVSSSPAARRRCVRSSAFTGAPDGRTRLVGRHRAAGVSANTRQVAAECSTPTRRVGAVQQHHRGPCCLAGLVVVQPSRARPRRTGPSVMSRSCSAPSSRLHLGGGSRGCRTGPGPAPGR